MQKSVNQSTYINRDLSWITFNERVLQEAARTSVPLFERFKFISIYSSNLDEFYRVRMPTLMALHGAINDEQGFSELLCEINDRILRQLKYFGSIIEDSLIKELRKLKIHLLYNEPIPDFLIPKLQDYFFHTVAAYQQIIPLVSNTGFFPENNKLYLVVMISAPGRQPETYILNIPSDVLSRFYSVTVNGTQYIIFLDDIIKLNINHIFGNRRIEACHSFKITRDAEFDLEDEFSGNLARKIEKQLIQRDMGLATRFLYEPGMPQKTLITMGSQLNLTSANFIAGGTYHNLKDFANLPLSDLRLSYEPWPAARLSVPAGSLFENIRKQDMLLHPPFHAYDLILRFFNEAAIDPSVQRIYITLYRVASDSRIANALITAARNGKKVTVFVELKARFDEANNLRWSKKMRKAGVRIIESIPGLKVHAKLALVKRKREAANELIGLFSTGNFNESTARFYTDHILMTTNKVMVKEAEKLFRILKKRKRKVESEQQDFQHLLVGQFNLQPRFLALINQEIKNASNGLPASIIIKFNNLEEQVMIDKLYEASAAGVKIELIVRGICCLSPGVKVMSENIHVRRIVDRYLEHGRVFIFQNNSNPLVYLGSADWMIRNIHRRIEVCFPVYDVKLKAEIMKLIQLQLKDTAQAVWMDSSGQNQVMETKSPRNYRSQKEIYKWLTKRVKP